jgi:hypothetical protein
MVTGNIFRLTCRKSIRDCFRFALYLFILKYLKQGNYYNSFYEVYCIEKVSHSFAAINATVVQHFLRS